MIIDRLRRVTGFLRREWASRRGLLLVWTALILVWLGVSVPLILGEKTFYYRDVFSNNLPLKAYGAHQLEQGRVPAINTSWGLGQPFRGNPSSLAFYPGNLIYLVLPFWSAFNSHFALHWLIAFLGMWFLARELAMGREAALLAALTYAAGGWFLSTMNFYNLITVAAWWPWVMWGAHRGRRRGIAWGGLACGLALLGGEPITALLGTVPMLVAACYRSGFRRGLGVSMAIGSIGLLISLPQLVATLRVLEFTFRGGYGTIAGVATSYALHPLRLLELLVPFPFGIPGALGRFRFWAMNLAPHTPFYLTIYAGAVGLWLALAAAWGRRSFLILAASGVLLAVLLVWAGEEMVGLTGGLFRFPEKFLLWTGLAIPLLAGWGYEVVLKSRAWRRAAVLSGALVLGVGVLSWLAHQPALEFLVGERQLADAVADLDPIIKTQMRIWSASLCVLGGLLAGAGWLSARWGVSILVLQMLGLAQLAPVVMLDDTKHYREPGEWVRRAGAGASVLKADLVVPRWKPRPDYEIPDDWNHVLKRLWALDLAQTPGVAFGLDYPLAPDLEGLSSPYHMLMLTKLKDADWAVRYRWLRLYGLDYLTVYEHPNAEGLELVDEAVRLGAPAYLYRVRDPAPRAWWPAEVRPVRTPLEAVHLIGATPDPVETVYTSSPVDHHPGGRVELVVETPDRLELEVQSGGGLLVIQRAYQHLYEARAGSQPLRTLHANLTLLGVEVPPGDHRVVVEVSNRPELLAGGLALALGGLCLWVGFRW